MVSSGQASSLSHPDWEGTTLPEVKKKNDIKILLLPCVQAIGDTTHSWCHCVTKGNSLVKLKMWCEDLIRESRYSEV